jgi:hypothetical protein
MKNVLIIIPCLIFIQLSCSTVNCPQSSGFEIISLKNYYRGKGAIIPKEYEYYNFKGVSIRFTPTLEQIIKAEAILKDSLMYLCKKYSVTDDYRECYNYYKETYKKYYRFYVGFIDDHNQTIIDINLFNYSSYESRNRLSGWECDFIFGGGEFWESNTWSAQINIITGEVKL